MSEQLIMWSVFGLLVVIMLVIDLGLNRKSHEISFREALTWTAVWISLALVFNIGVDSLPAVFAVTRDPFIVYTSNVFAIMGLRALYFLLSNVMGMFAYLKLGISFVLAFVGVKMLLAETRFEIPVQLSLGVIFGVLFISIITSILMGKKGHRLMCRMKLILFTVSILTACVTTNSFALNCDCSDWMNKGGYCVDYIKEKIPVFPIPQSTTAIASLKTKPVSEITEGDVVIFNFSKYWHVAYVEKVHRDQNGAARLMDISEMNFGDRLTRDEFKDKWKSRNESEWQRAICCGVTDRYDELSFRNNVAVSTVTQIWSPESDDIEVASGRKGSRVIDKAKEVLNRFVEFVEQVL